MRTVYCQRCRKAQQVEWRIPPICAHCLAPGQWRTEPPDLDDLLTRDDRAFLASIHIAATVTD